VEETAEQVPESDSGGQSEDELRKELYEQFDIGKKGELGIRYIIPRLDKTVETEKKYDIDERSKILAQIALFKAYEDAGVFRTLTWSVLLIAAFDVLHYLNPQLIGILFVAITTFNGFVGSLRSPEMMAAELEGVQDEEGMPADYRTTAYSSVNTNVTLVLFTVAVMVQLLVTSSVVQGEVLTQNLWDGVIPAVATAFGLFTTPILYGRLRSKSD